MERLYAYVGSPAARARAEGTPEGAPISSREALGQWVDAHPESVREAATVVIDARGTLRLAPRRSEHVACAAGAEVRFAGEIAFERGAAAVRWCSNQSSGYCPEPASHAPLRRALAALGLKRVPAFDPSCAWRRCVACAQINLVKDADLTCACCDTALPEAWNFALDPPLPEAIAPLRDADCFETGPAGFGDVVSAPLRAYLAAAEADDARVEDLVWLARHADPGGRVYAGALLLGRDDDDARRALDALRADGSWLSANLTGGCIFRGATVAALTRDVAPTLHATARRRVRSDVT